MRRHTTGMQQPSLKEALLPKIFIRNNILYVRLEQ